MIIDELAVLDQTLAVFQDATAPGSLLMRDSLDHRRVVLVDELERAMSSDLVVTLDGAPVEDDGSIAVGALARFLAPLQDSVQSVAQALASVATRAGLIEGAIREESQLRLRATFAGSFGLELAGPRQIVQGNLFDDEPEASLFETAVGQVLDVIEAASDPQTFEVEIVNQVAELGQRSTTHLLALSNAVISQRLSVQMAWSPPTTHQRVVTIGYEDADRLVQTLSRIEVGEERRNITGRLTGASLLRRTFEIQADDGTVIRGSVDDSIAHRIEDHFGKVVNGEIVVAITRSTLTGKEVERYTLAILAGPLDDQTPAPFAPDER